MSRTGVGSGGDDSGAAAQDWRTVKAECIKAECAAGVYSAGWCEESLFPWLHSSTTVPFQSGTFVR